MAMGRFTLSFNPRGCDVFTPNKRRVAPGMGSVPRPQFLRITRMGTTVASYTWTKFRRRAFLKKNLAVLKPHSPGEELKKCLNYGDLLMLGLGAMIGAGVFVLTGQAARDHAGPAVTLSYLIAAFVACVTALCYTEFAVDMPVAGSAFNYISLIFGEFLAWVAAIEMIMEYTLTSGAVSKGFSSYFATLLGLDSDQLLVFKKGWLVVDPVACSLVVLLSLLLAFGIKESSTVNAVVSGMNVAVVLFIIAMSAPKIDIDNYTPFLPKEMGLPGVFTAASTIFYGFVGFDALATVAEEVKKPSRDIPLGMMGSLALVAILYVGMAASITGMLPYKDIDIHAPFSVVFNNRGLKWVGFIVSFGAVTGTMTAALVMLLGQARIHMVLAREKFVPSFLAKVHPTLKTPVNATLFTMVTAGIPALLLDINLISNMVSMGILTTMALVCLGVIYRTYHNERTPNTLLVVRLGLLVVFSILEGLSSANEWGLPAIFTFMGLWLVTTLSLYLCPVVYRSPNFNVPLKPIVPAIGILASIHLITSLEYAAFIRFGVWQAIGLAFYFGYSLQRQSMPPPQSKEGADAALLAEEEVIERTERNEEEGWEDGFNPPHHK